jgi:hypothetical protein
MRPPGNKGGPHEGDRQDAATTRNVGATISPACDESLRCNAHGSRSTRQCATFSTAETSWSSFRARTSETMSWLDAHPGRHWWLLELRWERDRSR